MKKSKFFVSNIELKPSRILTIIYMVLSFVSLCMPWMVELDFSLRLLLLLGILCWGVYEWSRFQREGRLLSLQFHPEGELVLTYGSGLMCTVTLVKERCFATRTFAYLFMKPTEPRYPFQKKTAILFYDAMQEQDYRNLVAQLSMMHELYSG